LASVMRPRPDSDLKTELNFSVNDSNTGLPLNAIAEPPTGEHIRRMTELIIWLC
jgi:hypothetical protein